MSSGDFVWYDVMTTDVEGAERFYAAVVGWTMQDSGMPGQRYTLISDGKRLVGGIMPVPAEAEGVPPMWMGYIGVSDLDAKARQLGELGGMVQRGPQDIPGVGRFCIVSDPQGAGFILFEPAPGSARDALPLMAEKTIGWRELHAESMPEAFAFYEKLFGWRKVEAHDMGPFVYQTFATGGAIAAGGMMTRMPDTPHPFWAYYISVSDIDAAVERALAHGGSRMMDIHEVPGGSWICPMVDPQGAHFSLIGPRGRTQ
ncbi:MAG: VOC family protein [Rhizobiaceae bacterium]